MVRRPTLTRVSAGSNPALASYASIFGRAFAQVVLVAINITQVARGHYGGAFAAGCAISFVWWINARSAGRSDAPGAAAVYALGAGVGTVTGMYLSALMG